LISKQHGDIKKFTRKCLLTKKTQKHLYSSRMTKANSSLQSSPDAINDSLLLCRRVNKTIAILKTSFFFKYSGKTDFHKESTEHCC